MPDDLLHAHLTKRLIGVYYDVYNELGFGFLESVYQRALEIALASARVRFDRQVPVPVWFRGHQIGDYRADLLVEGCVILELKAASCLTSAHTSQLLNYLRATEIEIGLLLNFGPKPEFRRLAFANERKNHRG